MAKWEAGLTAAGAGCPSCQGFYREDPTPVEQLSQVNEPERPPWVRPDPKVLWECEGCAVEAVIDPDDGDLDWQGGKKVHYHRGYAFHYGQHLDHEERPEESPPHVIGDESYCPGCATTCRDCDASIFTRSELIADCYDPGASFLPEGKYGTNEAVCVDCYEKNYLDEE
tara:strand:- start:1230 stop:1736 length:507 start_codon:yes stop_codon:yes gene_type:complete